MNERQAEQKLPRGMTCGDCKWLERCRMLFQQRPESTECDWSPHRFRLRDTPATHALGDQGPLTQK
jgi:hypothetical protein